VLERPDRKRNSTFQFFRPIAKALDSGVKVTPLFLYPEI
jgi:hypothetical protein